MAIVVRPITRADASILEATPDGVFDDPVDLAAATRFLEDPRHHIIGALDEGALIGFLSAVVYEHPDKPRPNYWINELGVRESHQRQGVAKRLMQAALEQAKTLGCREAWVATESDNVAANKVYAAIEGGEIERDLVMYTYKLAE